MRKCDALNPDLALAAVVWLPRLGRRLLLLVLAVCFAGQLTVFAAAAERASKPKGLVKSKYQTLSLRGSVVWLADAMRRRYGIKSVAEASQRVLALQTPAGELHPLVEDVRGRSFRTDVRLRGVEMELLVRRYEGSPMVQVIRIYTLKKGGKYELDYWCDICAIAMFELKACDCCQGPIRLRERKVAGTDGKK